MRKRSYTHSTSNREYLARGGLWFADDFHGDSNSLSGGHLSIAHTTLCIARVSRKALRLPGFPASRLPGFPASRLPGFPGSPASRLPGFPASRLPGFLFSTDSRDFSTSGGLLQPNEESGG